MDDGNISVLQRFSNESYGVGRTQDRSGVQRNLSNDARQNQQHCS